MDGTAKLCGLFCIYVLVSLTFVFSLLCLVFCIYVICLPSRPNYSQHLALLNLPLLEVASY